jgi:adenylate cyclase
VEIASKTWLSQLPRRFSGLSWSAVRRTLRLTSGLVLFAYIAAHLLNHALGLVSLKAAEAGMEIAVEVWYSLPGTVLLYGAAAVHFVLALWAVYERRTFRLPPAELLRIALGFTLPIILIGHFAATRLAYELFGLSSDYSRVVSNLWVADSQGWQLGVMAPGWIHGCMGLHFAFSRRPLYRQLRFVLFAAALLLPVFSGLGFVAMGKELSTNEMAAAAALDFLSPGHAAERIGIAQWRNELLLGYFAIIGATFAARAIRNMLERGRKRLVSISYPARTVRVPRGWSVLEASRSFHLPHASMCGGRARCSTCRVRVTAGGELCPPAGTDERATLERIGAPPDVRLACQLRPRGDISVVPVVRTERPIYRQTAPRRSDEREIVVLFCDFLNRAELAGEHIPQDLLYVLTLYVEAIGNAIRTAGGTLSGVGLESVSALFGLDCAPEQAARQALQAAGAIARVMSDLNDRLGRQWDCKVKIAVSIHAGRSVVGEINSSDPPAVMAIGEAMNLENELRKLAAARGKSFAISETVYAAAGLEPIFEDKVLLQPTGTGAPVAAGLSMSAPDLPPAWTRRSGMQSRRAALQRLWTGSPPP